jgi:hypothetical protein
MRIIGMSAVCVAALAGLFSDPSQGGEKKPIDARARAVSQNNLKQIGLAVHTYYDSFKALPFARGKKLHPGLSWRVAILPYLEQEALYRQFKLDEPWDSEHNLKLVEILPKQYAPVGGVKAKPGHTFYQTLIGPGTFGEVEKFAAITDGTSNTLMVVEAGEPVVWTKPADLVYDAKKPLPKLGGLFPGYMNVLMGDASARWVNLTKLEEPTLRALITTQGGEVLPAGWDE